jgi:hypothetical protein
LSSIPALRTSFEHSASSSAEHAYGSEGNRTLSQSWIVSLYSSCHSFQILFLGKPHLQLNCLYLTIQTISLTIRRSPHFYGQNARPARAAGRTRHPQVIRQSYVIKFQANQFHKITEEKLSFDICFPKQAFSIIENWKTKRESAYHEEKSSHPLLPRIGK